MCLTLCLAGCSDDPGDAEPGDPTSIADAARAQCTVADPEGELIVHPGSVKVDVETRLTDVALIGAVNLQIVEKAVTSFTGNPEVRGIIRDYPPLKTAGLADSLADWADRRPLSDLVLEPEDGPQAILVALRLIDFEESGHLTGVELSSRGSAGTTSQDYLQPVLVEPPGALCTIDEIEATRAWTP